MSFGEHDENLMHSHVHVIVCYHTLSNRDQYLDFVSLVSGQLKVCQQLSNVINVLYKVWVSQNKAGFTL